MKIFITGASGFVGGAITQHLKDRHTIYAMARSESSSKKVTKRGAVPVSCDLQTIQANHLGDCEVVIHCAAFAEEWGTDEEFFLANVTGTKTLLDAARAAGVNRFIFIGTEAALFRGQDMLNVDETYPYAENSPYPYSRTKGEAERLVLKANSANFKTLSLRPRMVWGPNDLSILPVILGMIEVGKFAWIGNGSYQTSSTHIGNLAHAVELALTRGVGGNAYFIADNEVSSMKKFLSRYIETQQIEVPSKSIPKPIARFAAWAVEKIWKTFYLRRKPPLVRFTIDIMSAHCTVNTAKAKSELGYQPADFYRRGI